MVQVLCYVGENRMATCWLPPDKALCRATHYWGKDGPYDAIRFV